MKSGKNRERVGHFFEALIIIAVAKFHVVAEGLTGWQQVAVYLAIYFGTVGALLLIEWILRQLWSIRKIELPVTGTVDGVWLDEVFEEDQRIGGSILHVKTTRPDEFHVSGETWSEDGQYIGWWDGDGVYDGGASFGYAYQGGETEDRKPLRTGNGAGQYYFYQSENGHASRMEGTFSAHGLHQPRTLKGRRYGRKIDEKKQRAILDRFLKNPEEPFGQG